MDGKLAFALLLFCVVVLMVKGSQEVAGKTILCSIVQMDVKGAVSPAILPFSNKTKLRYLYLITK